jgi:type II secretory pathway pseudopilin PulG
MIPRGLADTANEKNTRYPEAGYMSRHSRKACGREAGFSFVELLVTIIIAGIAFAAMVPFFVQAQQKNSDDNMRVMTLQLARDKIEKLRQLDYDAITQANLDSETFADGQFGNTYVLKSGTGSTRDVSLTYTVTPWPAGASSGAESYKQVEVSVSWTAPPSPVYPAVLSTVVYKQYAGPQIIEFSIDPTVLEEVEPDVWHITGTPVAVDVYVAPSDIGLMVPAGVVDQTKWGYMRYSVSALNGTLIDADDVRVPVTGDPGHYQWTWDNSIVPDGIYVIKAIAYSSSKQQGNEASIAITVKVRTPPAPQSLVATPRDKEIQLAWSPTPITDFLPDGRYEVDTSGDGTTWTHLKDATAPVLTTPLYLHSGLTNGQDYYYRVRVLDTDGNASAWSVIGPVQPLAQADTVAPTVPGTFTVAKIPAKQNIRLTWTASTDAGTPTSGVLGYDVERSAAAGGPWTQIRSATVFGQLLLDDTNVGWSATWYYRVRAVDVAGNASAYTVVLSATTDAQPKHNMTVVNTASKDDMYVRVQSATTGLYWTQGGTSQATAPAEVLVRKNGKTAMWSNLPEDIYNVSARYASTLTKATQWSADPWTVSFP